MEGDSALPISSSKNLLTILNNSSFSFLLKSAHFIRVYPLVGEPTHFLKLYPLWKSLPLVSESIVFQPCVSPTPGCVIIPA